MSGFRGFQQAVVGDGQGHGFAELAAGKTQGLGAGGDVGIAGAQAAGADHNGVGGVDLARAGDGEAGAASVFSVAVLRCGNAPQGLLVVFNADRHRAGGDVASTGRRERGVKRFDGLDRGVVTEGDVDGFAHFIGRKRERLTGAGVVRACGRCAPCRAQHNGGGSGSARPSNGQCRCTHVFGHASGGASNGPVGLLVVEDGEAGTGGAHTARGRGDGGGDHVVGFGHGVTGDVDAHLFAGLASGKGDSLGGVGVVGAGGCWAAEAHSGRARGQVAFACDGEGRRRRAAVALRHGGLVSRNAVGCRDQCLDLGQGVHTRAVVGSAGESRQHRAEVGGSDTGDAQCSKVCCGQSRAG